MTRMEQKKITLPKGWEIEKIKGNEIILKESKEELPETWFECLCKFKGDLEYIDTSSAILHHDFDGSFPSDENLIPKGFGKPMLALMQLLICREIYRNGWEPDWTYQDNKYCIIILDGKVRSETFQLSQKLLSFQSEEVRDKFLKNFYVLIEEAKKLI